MRKTVSTLIMDYFKRHDSQDLYIGPVLDWVTKQYFKMYHGKPYDALKSFSSLVDEGKLTMVSEGVYRYDPAINKPHNDIDEMLEGR